MQHRVNLAILAIAKLFNRLTQKRVVSRDPAKVRLACGRPATPLIADPSIYRIIPSPVRKKVFSNAVCNRSSSQGILQVRNMTSCLK